MKNTIKAVLDEYYNINMFSEIARSQIAEKIEEALKKNSGKSTQNLNEAGVPTPVISTVESVQPAISKPKVKPTAVVKTKEKDDKVKPPRKKESVKKEPVKKEISNPTKTKAVSTPRKNGGFKNLGNKGVNSGRKSSKRTRTRSKKSN